MLPQGEPDDAEVFDFLDEYTRDVESGRNEPLTYYLRRFPGHEESIAREFLARQELSNKRAPTSTFTHAGNAIDAHGDERRIGPYRLLRELGRGGQGAVWLADDTRIARRVALKFLPTSFAMLSADARRRLQREAEVVSRLEHPSICPVYEAQIDGETPYIAMRFIEGETLAGAITRAKSTSAKSTSAQAASDSTALKLGPRTAPDVRRVLQFFERTARALHAAHEAGVIHRDIKPGNVMLAHDGEPVVLDFGQARDEHAALSDITLSGEVLGTPAYMSPEQVTGSARAIDRRTDVWSLGASLYEALTLERPFAGASVSELLIAIQTKPLRDPREVNTALSDEVAVVLETALEKDVDRRYASALEFAEDLRRIREYEPIHAQPASTSLRLRRWARRHPALTGFITVLVLGLAWSLYLLAREEQALEREKTARAGEKQALDFALGRHLAQRAINVLDEDASASLALGIKAVGFADHFETRAALLSALAACRMSGVLDGEPARRFLDLQITPDSKRVIAGLDDGTARMYSIGGGKNLTRISGHPGEVWHVRTDPRGERIFTASIDGVVRVFDANSGAALQQLPTLERELQWIELDHAGELLVALDGGGLARIWSIADWSLVSEIRTEAERFNCAHFSPDGRRLLLFSLAVHRDAPRSNVAVLWETRTGRQLGELGGHSDAITCAEFGASGSLAMTASIDGSARLWSVPECRPIGAPFEHGAPVTCAHLSPDEKQLVTGTNAGEASSAWLWDLASRARVALRGEHRERIAGVEFSLDGQRIASVSLGMVLHTWSAHDGRELSRQSTQIYPMEVMWSPDGQRIVTLANEPTNDVWYGENPPDAYALIGHGAPLTNVSFSPDGMRALTAAEDGTARLWHTPRNASERGDFAPGTELFKFGDPTQHIDRAVFSPDGTLVLTLSQDGEAQCWNAVDGKQHGPPMRHPVAVRAAEFTSDGKRLVTIAEDHKARLFTLEGGTRCVPVELDTRATCAHFTPDARHLIVARDDNVLCVFDVESCRLAHEHIWQSERDTGVVDFAVRADGGQIALACNDRRIRFFDPLIEGAARLSIVVFPMQDIAYNSTGTRLLATGPDKRGAMRLHDLAGNSQFRIQVFHSLPVTCGAFSPDGAFALTGSKDKSVFVRRSDDGVPFAHLTGHDGPVTCAAFSRDNGALRVITGSADGTARIWPVEPLAPALARVPRPLSDLEDAREKRLAKPLEYR